MTFAVQEVLADWHEDHAQWTPLADRLDNAGHRNGLHLDPVLREALDLSAGDLLSHLRQEHDLLLPDLDARDAVLAEDVRVDQAVLRNAAHAIVHFAGTGQDPCRAVRALASALRAHVRLHEQIRERFGLS